MLRIAQITSVSIAVPPSTHGGTERMVQFQRRQERRKRHQAQAEDGNKQDH